MSSIIKRILQLFQTNKKLLYIVTGVAGVIIIALVAVLVNVLVNGTMIKEKHWEIVRESQFTIAVNRNIGKVENLEYLLNTLLENYPKESMYYINDDRYCYIISSPYNYNTETPRLRDGVVYENIGTAYVPNRADIDNSKTRELNKFIERFSR